MSIDTTTLTSIIACVLFFPLYVLVLSMCSYIGKVFAVRLLFKRVKGGVQEYGKEER